MKKKGNDPVVSAIAIIICFICMVIIIKMLSGMYADLI